MKEKSRHIYQIIAALIIMLVAAGCQTGRADSVNLLLQPDSPTMVSFPLMAASQIYAFNADAQLPIEISLVPITRDLTYTAELQDDHGTVMASVASSMIQNAVLTVDPGNQHYQMVIKSNNSTLQGILSMQVARTRMISDSIAAMRAAAPATPGTIVVPYQPIALSTANPFTPCSVTGSTGVSVNLRSGPGTNYGVVGALVYGTALSVNGQSSNDWYQVVYNGQLVWVAGSVTTASGDCKNLPDVTPPALNNGTVQLVIADNGWGSVNENIESTAVNSHDLIVISDPAVINSEQHYQEFTLTLLCSGSGSEALRWGAAEQPSLKCGGSVVMPLTATYRQQVIAVTLPQTPVYNNVQYTLMATRHV